MILRNLRVRLILWFLLIETVTLLLFSVLLYGLLSRNLYGHHDESLLDSQQHLLSLLDPYARENFRKMPADIDKFVEGAIEIRSREGKAVLSTEEFKSLSQHLPSLVMGEQVPKFLTVETKSGEPLRILITPLAGKQFYVLQVSLLGDINNTLASLKITLAVVLPLVLLATSFGGYLIASRALAPVDQITRRAREIQAGNLDQRLDIKTSDIELRNLVTTLNEMMERLNRTFLSMQQFVADASHELKTPLTIMTGTLEVALNRDRSAVEYKEAIQTVLDEMNQMSRIVNQLLLLSSLDAGEPEPRRQIIELGDLVQKDFELVQPLAEDKGLRASLRLQTKPKISGDPGQISQAIINLLDNSIKYTPAGGEIEVTVADRDANAVVSISDTGIGIAAEELEAIFERFYQVDKSRSGENRGSGLGLSIVKKIAEAHGGAICVRSSTGQGATFSLSFPLANRS